jgi:acetoin utilization deacetylase AcuC-like enzyme
MENIDKRSLAQLKLDCAAEGLPSTGTKAAMIKRLQTNAAEKLVNPPSELNSDDNNVEVNLQDVLEKTEKVNTPSIITKSNNLDIDKLPPINHAKHVENVLDKVKERFHMLNIRYDSNKEVFLLEGGRQGRVTTTARQPLKPIMLLCEGYVSLSRRGRNSPQSESIG